jgi:hypothetical protein
MSQFQTKGVAGVRVNVRMFVLASVIYTALFFCGCGGGNGTGPGGGGSPANLTGNYEGTRWFVYDTSGVKYRVGVVHGPIVQTGTVISTSIINFFAPFEAGATCFEEARVISGKVNGSDLTMTLTAYDNGNAAATVNLTGTLNSSLLSGQVEIAGANNCSAQPGAFALTAVGPVTGNWSGELTSSTGEMLEISGALTQTVTITSFAQDNYGYAPSLGYDTFGNPAVDGFAVNDTLTSSTTTSACFPSTNVLGGRIAGTHLLIDIGTSEQFIRLDGLVTTQGNSFEGTYTIHGGSCNDQFGTVRMQR